MFLSFKKKLDKTVKSCIRIFYPDWIVEPKFMYRLVDHHVYPYLDTQTHSKINCLINACILYMTEHATLTPKHKHPSLRLHYEMRCFSLGMHVQAGRDWSLGLALLERLMGR